MLDGTDATENLDPQLLQPPQIQPQPRAGSVGVPSRQNSGTSALGDGDGDDDGDGDSVQSGGNARKRQKMNLSKCDQCRDARKKVFTPPC